MYKHLLPMAHPRRAYSCSHRRLQTCYCRWRGRSTLHQPEVVPDDESQCRGDSVRMSCFAIQCEKGKCCSALLTATLAQFTSASLVEEFATRKALWPSLFMAPALMAARMLAILLKFMVDESGRREREGERVSSLCL